MPGIKEHIEFSTKNYLVLSGTNCQLSIIGSLTGMKIRRRKSFIFTDRNRIRRKYCCRQIHRNISNRFCLSSRRITRNSLGFGMNFTKRQSARKKFLPILKQIFNWTDKTFWKLIVATGGKFFDYRRYSLQSFWRKIFSRFVMLNHLVSFFDKRFG